MKWDSSHQHGRIECSCGRLISQCKCSDCVLGTPKWRQIERDSCLICLERLRAARLGTVYPLPAVDLSAGIPSGTLHLETLTAAMRVSDLIELAYQLRGHDPDELLSLQFFVEDRQEVDASVCLDQGLPKILLDGDGGLEIGICTDCGRRRPLSGVFCVACGLERVHEAQESA